MKTEFSRARSRWGAMLIAASVLGACGQIEENPGEQEVVEEQQALNGVLLGMSSGNIYTGVIQPLSTYSEQMMCELNQLGARWLRIDASVATTDEVAYRRIIEKAHARQIQVLVTLPTQQYCGEDNDQAAIDAFTESYKNELIALANKGTPTVKPDAFEIGNDPNVMEPCPDGVSRYRVGPHAFASLLRKVWEWKQQEPRPELIVSGAIKDVFFTINPAPTPPTTTDPYWNGFFNSQAFVTETGRIRPFDYLGVHPANDSKMDYNCINQGYTTCFTPWKNSVKTGLQGAAARANLATGTSDTKIFVTESGFQVSGTNLCVGLENCTLTFSLPTGSAPYQQMAAGMHAAGEAFVTSGVTPVALVSNYRDDELGTYGLRGVWDVDLNKYRVKTAGWKKFQSMAGVAIPNINAEACWLNGSYFSGEFQSSDFLRTTSSNDWAYGSHKAVCAPAERIMGLSKSLANGGPHVAVCYKDPLDSSRYWHPVPETNPPPTTPDAPRCTVRNVAAGDDRGATPTTSEDWDTGNYRAECSPTEYVAGMAQSLSFELTHVLCCPLDPAKVSAQKSCEAVVFGSGDDRQSTEHGNWDPNGHKGQCGVGRYVAGVSRTPEGLPNALLCCTQ